MELGGIMTLEEQVLALNDEQLSQHWVFVNEERNKRETLSRAKTEVDRIMQSVYNARGGDGRAYVQPTGSHDAYPLGAIVSFNGKQYKSLINANVWTPTAYPGGWAEVTETVPPVPEPEPISADPWVAGESVKAGDLRMYDEKIYSAVQPHTTQEGWEPPKVAALWALV